eukprot:COSAG05_NODE_1271_length_5315_cov_2.397738_1_plen_224_part_00
MRVGTGKGSPATVVVSHVPGDLGRAPNLPDGAGGHLWQRRASCAVVREACVHVVARLERIGAPGRAPGQAADVRDGGAPRRPPGIVAIDVLRGAGGGVAVDSAVLWIVHCRLLSKAAEVGLPAAGHVVAGWATDEAALAVVEGRLAVLALGAGDVGVMLRVHAGKIIDGVPRSRVHHRAVAGRDRKGGREGSHAEHAGRGGSAVQLVGSWASRGNKEGVAGSH